MNLPVKRPETFSLQPTTFQEMMTFADLISKSDLAPKDFKGKAGNCVIAMQMGAELGLQPMQAIQNIAVINGRPCLWGDAMLAIVKGSPLCEGILETFDEGMMTATCTVKRKGEEPHTQTFSQTDAKTAGLWTKSGPWTTYPKRMLTLRARGFALRNTFPDLLKGIHSAEEQQDIISIDPSTGTEKKSLSELVNETVDPTTKETKQIEEHVPVLSDHEQWSDIEEHFTTFPESIKLFPKQKTVADLALVPLQHFDFVWKKLIENKDEK